MIQFERWIDGISRESTVDDAARRTLTARLEAVEHYLSLVADSSNLIENVHQLRVSTRRAVTALHLYQKWLPRRHAEWLQKHLKEIRRSAGEARDCDVLILHLQEDGYQSDVDYLLKLIRKHRAEAQPAIVAERARLLKSGRLRRRIRKLLKGIPSKRPPKRTPRYFGKWAPRQMQRILKKFFRAAHSTASAPEALHRLRIAGKKLRYAMELLASAFPESFQTELYPQIETLQNKLGALNDRVTAIHRYQKLRRKAKSKTERANTQAMLDQEQQRLVQSREEFKNWWTENRCLDLENRFAKMIQNTAAEPTMSESEK